jgi:ATP-dependent RNA helicase DDX23/PRP28
VLILWQVGRAVDRIEQRVIFVKGDNDKRQHLDEVMRDGPPPPIIIFVNKKKCDLASLQLACFVHAH